VMASQKLDFLQKVDQAKVKEAMEAKGALPKAAAAPSTPAKEASAAPKKESMAKAILKALGERIAKSPDLAAEVDAVIAFQISDPESAFTVDLKTAPGGVKEGAAKDATTTLKLADEDLSALARGESAESLHQRGKLRVEGDIRPARKLAFLKGLV
jgi:(3R)-3-hydroxyacyl-CoA dehydrogenase / 3a,7a,12a-trihydroxy-5b-cholest-24-enoyl-CoA hydratase / enoyl-CoA hydratase 2